MRTIILPVSDVKMLRMNQNKLIRIKNGFFITLISLIFFNHQVFADETKILNSVLKEAIPYIIGFLLLLWFLIALIISMLLNFLSNKKRKLFLPNLIVVILIGAIAIFIDLNTFVFYNATPETWNIFYKHLIPNVLISLFAGLTTGLITLTKLN